MAPRESSFVKQRNTATSSPQATPSEPTDLASPRKINERQTSEGPSGCVPVKAPMMGVFYAAPAPDAPPFVRVGDLVKEGADLCIIEVMKVMNNIKSPCEGVIEAIHAENANMVELGEAIFWIKPKP